MISKNEKDEHGILEITRVIIFATLIAFLIRSVLFEPFAIPSGSMKPNFIEGDYLFVSKYSYGISRYSFPFGPKIFKGRILQFKKPERGEVIVFRLPSDPKTYFIKRLIGIPGDRVQVTNGLLYINGKKAKRKYVKDFVDVDLSKIGEYKETLADGTSYSVLDETPYGHLDNTKEFIVPEKHYFFMGDNRDNSADSRGELGFIHEEYLAGRAEIILFSNPEPLWKIWDWVSSFRADRFLFKVNHGQL
jgi:signal peptidase I